MMSGQGDGSYLHQIARRMLGIETNSYQLACLVAHIEKEALKRPFASGSWICPGSNHLACLMSYVVPSHLSNERTDISSVYLEPPVVRDLKPQETTYQQKESPCKRQIENDDRSHVPFLSKSTKRQRRLCILMVKQQGSLPQNKQSSAFHVFIIPYS